MGTIILEGVDTSLMAQKTPPALNDTFINSGLLATLVGTLGRVIGDSIITVSALLDNDIFTDFVNAVSDSPKYFDMYLNRNTPLITFIYSSDVFPNDPPCFDWILPGAAELQHVCLRVVQ